MALGTQVFCQQPEIVPSSTKTSFPTALDFVDGPQDSSSRRFGTQLLGAIDHPFPLLFLYLISYGF